MGLQKKKRKERKNERKMGTEDKEKEELTNKDVDKVNVFKRTATL